MFVKYISGLFHWHQPAATTTKNIKKEKIIRD